MKIGILTFHCAHNYGAMLQTYATQELLRGAGHDVEVIDYRPSYLTEPYKWFRLSRIRKKDGSMSLKHVLAEIVLLPFRYVRYRRFNRFMTTRMLLSETVCPESFKGNYDAIIIGSDQVWNIRQTGGKLDDMYIASFPFEKGPRLYIADAVSMEQNLMERDHIQQLSQAFKNFDLLTAREEDAVEWLNTFSSKPFRHIQDPVFQIDPKKWQELALPVNRKKPYLLVYKMRDHKNIDVLAKQIAKKNGLDIIEILSDPDASRLLIDEQAVSVEKFLGYFAGASFVLTTSFHGTAFSLIFKRQFYSLAFGDGKDSRVKSLIASLGVADRMIPVQSELPEISEIDYVKVSSEMEKIRKEVSDLLLGSLS